MEYLIIGGLLVVVLILILTALYQTGSKVHWRIRAQFAEAKIAVAHNVVERLREECEKLGVTIADEPLPTCANEWPEVLEDKN